ncbi:unnamed protein product [Rhodiola kirilowii]
MEVDDDNLPEFFKVYISHHSSKQMLIPNEFVDYMGERKFGSAELIGLSGQTWRVELVEDGKDLYFTDGWRDFVKDNMIQDGEFLFFKFHGNLIFSITMYDKSMCEKRDLFINICSRGRDSKIEAGGEELNGVRHVKREESMGTSEPEGPLFPSEDKIAERTAFSDKPSFEKCVTVSNVQTFFNFNLPYSFVNKHSLSYKSNEKMVLRTSKNSSWEVKISTGHGKITLTKGWRAFVRENNIKVGDVCKFELLDRLEMMVHVVHWQEGIGQANINEAASEIRSLKRTVGVSQPGLRHGSPFIAKDQNVAARTMPSSVKPSFVLDMKKYHVERCMMNIPVWFIQENSLRYQSNEKMILRTKKDSSWPVNISESKWKTTYYYRFCGGWAAFVHDNNIKEGDTCEFELLNRLEMKVHITPSADESGWPIKEEFHSNHK